MIYEGWVRHRRFDPVSHEFSYRLSMSYLDLDELPARFRRSDYLGDPAVPLATAVRDLVEARTGRRPGGAVRLLTNLRSLGWCFNPISLYYCFDGNELPAVVFEVTNTPWGERHAYVVEQPGPARLDKLMHVSPFMPMDVAYHFDCNEPGDRLMVRFELEREGRAVFDADLDLQRAGSGPAPFWRHRLVPQKVTAGIYWQALRLWAKRAPLHRHPDRVP